MKKDLVHTERFFCFFYLSLLCSFFLLTVVAIWQRNAVRTVPFDKISVGDPHAVSYHINHVTEKNGTIQVEGWVVQKGVLYPYFNYGMDERGKGSYVKMRVACMNQGKGKLFLFPTQCLNRPDAERAIADGNKYQYSSFVARLPRKDLDNADINNLLFFFYNPNGSKTVYFSDIMINNEKR